VSHDGRGPGLFGTQDSPQPPQGSPDRDADLDGLEGLDAAALQAELTAAASVADAAVAGYELALEERRVATRTGNEEAVDSADQDVHARLAAMRAAQARMAVVREALWAAQEAEQVADGQEVDHARTDRFVDVEDFVARYFAHVIQRKLGGGLVWCARWWAHQEAANRLWTLWRGYEAARMQRGGSLSRWWVNQVDPHLVVLLSDRGPFSECRKGTHHDGAGLAHEPAPEGWWSVRSGDFEVPATAAPAKEADTDTDGSAP